MLYLGGQVLSRYNPTRLCEVARPVGMQKNYRQQKAWRYYVT